jgi:NADH-quinone oxidoreductase subunit J
MCGGLFAAIALPLMQDTRKLDEVAAPAGFGGVEEVGMKLFTEYGFAFELISVLIMVAVFGGVLLAKRKL